MAVRPDGHPSERLGVFGGTFDPPHRGHVRVATDVADRLDLDRMLWVPARVSPFKREETVTDAEIRLEMVRRAAELDPRFEVDARELDRPGPSYTIDTLESLRSEHPDAEIFLVLGADQFEDFPRWREPERIVRVVRLAVMNRAGASPRSVAPEVAAAVEGLEQAVVFVPVTDVDVSSTGVRARVAEGHDPADHVPGAVADVIRARGLYVL
ncbi:MAG: nicotinate-nucleotide adenylyltransferase [Gemmatimonadota bacterium]